MEIRVSILQNPLLPARRIGPVRRAGEAPLRRRRGALFERGVRERRRPHQVLYRHPQEGQDRAGGEVFRESNTVSHW